MSQNNTKNFICVSFYFDLIYVGMEDGKEGKAQTI